MLYLKRQPKKYLNFSWIDYLPKEYCYSFVLQHPKNNIHKKIEIPNLVLIAVYHICGNNVNVIPSYIYQTWSIFTYLSGIINFPKTFFANTYSELLPFTLKYTNMNEENWKGIVLWNYKTGDRTTLENPNYEIVLNMLSIPSLLQYHYLCVKKINKMDIFLETYNCTIGYYKHYKKAITILENFYTDFVNNLHESYMDVYVKKKCN